MEITWSTKLYCLIGNPIDKSLSPIIHNNIFKILNENSIYLAFNVEEKNLKNLINGFKSMNVQGFNVTIPYKKKIIDYLDDISPEANIIGAVNTVKNQNGKLIGYNTDGEGFLRTFYDENIDLKNKNILILGAGGAAYGIGVSLGLKEIKSISIGNRNLEKANLLQKRINKINSNIPVTVDNLSLNNIEKENIHIIINSTSIGMYPMENLVPIELNGFSKDTIIYDIVYKPQNTQLIEIAKLKGFKTLGGLSMLLNQAILSQKIWLDLREDDLNRLKSIEGKLSTYLK